MAEEKNDVTEKKLVVKVVVPEGVKVEVFDESAPEPAEKLQTEEDKKSETAADQTAGEPGTKLEEETAVPGKPPEQPAEGDQ